VVAFLEPEGWLVTRFVAGEIPPLERMREPEQLDRVARSLRVVHAGPPLTTRFDSFRVVETHRATAAARGTDAPARLDPAWETARLIEAARGHVERRPCHNDLLNANFIDDLIRIRIVDWEYAGMGDPFFDLGNFSINHELTPDQDAALLASYDQAQTADPARLARLTLMRVVSDFREAMWGVLQQAISTLDVDFVAYADEHFDRLLRHAAEDRFEQALASVRDG